MAYTGQGNRQPEIDALEHDPVSLAKRSLLTSVNDAGNAYLQPTIFDLVSSNPLGVVLVDLAGAPYVAGGGGGPAANVSAYISGTISLPVYVFTSATVNSIVGGTVTAIVGNGTVTASIALGTVTASVALGTVTASIALGTITANCAAHNVSSYISGTTSLPVYVFTSCTLNLNSVNVTCYHANYQHLSYTTTNFLVTLHTTGPTVVCATNLTRASVIIAYRTQNVLHAFVGGESHASGNGYMGIMSQTPYADHGPSIYLGAIHGTTTLDNSVVHVWERMWST